MEKARTTQNSGGSPKEDGGQRRSLRLINRKTKLSPTAKKSEKFTRNDRNSQNTLSDSSYTTNDVISPRRSGRLSAKLVQTQIVPKKNQAKKRESKVEDKLPKKQTKPKLTKKKTLSEVTKEKSAARVTKEKSAPKVTKVKSAPKVTKEKSAPKVTKVKSAPKVTKEKSAPKISKKKSAPKITKNKQDLIKKNNERDVNGNEEITSAKTSHASSSESFKKYGIIVPSVDEIRDKMKETKAKIEKMKSLYNNMKERYADLDDSIESIDSMEVASPETTEDVVLLDCKHLDPEQLNKYFNDNLQYLRDISVGAIHSSRHERFFKSFSTCSFSYAPEMCMFTSNQVQQLATTLEESVAIGNKDSSYFFKVLLPESA